MSRFDELRDGLSRGVTELVDSAERTSDPRSYDSMDGSPYIVQRSDYDRQDPPKDDMAKYWRQYETTPIVRKPIRSFASRVVEPGYYLELPAEVDEETTTEIYRWLENAAITEGETDKDIISIIKDSIIQRDVRGTAIIEKVYAKENRDVLMAVKQLNPETIEANTRPGQAILLHPDDNEKEDWDPPLTPEGEAAAYLQDLSEAQVSWGRSERIRRVGAGPDGDSRYPNRVGFTRNDIIKLELDADTGDIFGTSRIEAISDRIEGLKQKMKDNDEAIASKAYPMWLFKFGVGDDSAPWPREKINNFMSNHDMDKFHPGMKQGVRSDVDVETVSGETADIYESLMVDIDWILSAMPMARQAIGGFSSGRSGSGVEVSGMAQEQHIVREIREARRDIETEFTPLIQEKLEEKDIDEETAKDAMFKLGDPDESGGSEDPSVSTSRIEYKGVDDNDDDGGSGEQPQGEDPPSASDIGPFGDRRGVVKPDLSQSDEASLSEVSPRVDELHTLITETITEAREKALREIEQPYKDSPKRAAYSFSEVFNSAVSSTAGRQLRRDVKDLVKKELRTLDESNTHSVQHNERVKMFTEDIVDSLHRFADSVGEKDQIQLRRAANDGGSFELAVERMRNSYTESDISTRAYTIAHMEVHNSRENTKLAAFENDASVSGVRLVNNDPSGELTEALDGVEAYFDEGDIGSQIRDEVSESLYHEDFDPLPTIPPYRYGDTTTMEAIKNGD